MRAKPAGAEAEGVSGETANKKDDEETLFFSGLSRKKLFFFLKNLPHIATVQAAGADAVTTPSGSWGRGSLT
jgi:hypothetical protein